MPYCSRCGVEVDSHVERCPLCNAPIQHFPETEAGESRYPEDAPGPSVEIGDRTRRRVLWELLSLLYAIAVIVVIGSDVRVDGAIDWSLYPAASLALAWIYTTLAIYSRRRPGVSVPIVAVSTLVFMAVIDLIHGGLDWFLPLGLPIFLLCALLTGAVILVIVRTKECGLNIVAFILLGIAAFCVGTDLLISRYHSGVVDFTWSMVVVLTVVPVALILLFLHYRLRNRYDWKRIFHL